MPNSNYAITIHVYVRWNQRKCVSYFQAQLRIYEPTITCQWPASICVTLHYFVLLRSMQRSRRPYFIIDPIPWLLCASHKDTQFRAIGTIRYQCDKGIGQPERSKIRKGIWRFHSKQINHSCVKNTPITMKKLDTELQIYILDLLNLNWPV